MPIAVLINRGISVYRTMLNALAGDRTESTVYDVNATSSSWSNGMVCRGCIMTSFDFDAANLVDRPSGKYRRDGND